MSDGLKEKLIANEEAKDAIHNLESEYLNDNRVTVAPNVNFEMNPKTLTSFEIKPKDLRAKIEDYLESDGLTRDQVKLLLKQGAEDNFLFMITEETYDKLVDGLGLKLDNDNKNDLSNISGLLATARLEFNDKFSQSPNMKLDTTAAKFAQMMKSRQVLRDKSVWRVQALPIRATSNQPDLRQTNQSINDDVEDEDSFRASEKFKLEGTKTDPTLMERVPRITNQGLKNWLINLVFVFIS